MKPVVDGLAQEYSDRVDFVVYENVEGSPEVIEFSSDKGFQYVPTMVLVKSDGTELARWEGAVMEGDLRSALDEAP